MNHDAAASPAARWDAAASPPDQASRRSGMVTVLYAEHALGLIRLAHIMLGNRNAAEDVVQEAFLGLFRRWEHLHDPDKALGYVRSSVLNGCRSQLRRHRAVELEPSHQPPASSAEAALMTEEERREILSALRALPVRQREVLALRFYFDLPDQEIADALGISKSTVRSPAHRGVRALGRTLGTSS